MTTTTADEFAVAGELATWLRDRQYPNLELEDVRVERGVDSEGRDAWFFHVTLRPPADRLLGWDVEAIAIMRREVRDKALDLGLTYPWMVMLRADEAPEHEPE